MDVDQVLELLKSLTEEDSTEAKKLIPQFINHDDEDIRIEVINLIEFFDLKYMSKKVEYALKDASEFVVLHAIICLKKLLNKQCLLLILPFGQKSEMPVAQVASLSISYSILGQKSKLDRIRQILFTEKIDYHCHYVVLNLMDENIGILNDEELYSLFYDLMKNYPRLAEGFKKDLIKKLTAIP